jgi:hypothetical protein
VDVPFGTSTEGSIKRELGVRTEVACELANNEYESKFTPKLFNKLI